MQSQQKAPSNGWCFLLLMRWIRKPALGDSPVDCRNRRGFSAEKRIHLLQVSQHHRQMVLFAFPALQTGAADGMLFLPETGA